MGSERLPKRSRLSPLEWPPLAKSLCIAMAAVTAPNKGLSLKLLPLAKPLCIAIATTLEEAIADFTISYCCSHKKLLLLSH